MKFEVAFNAKRGSAVNLESAYVGTKLLQEHNLKAADVENSYISGMNEDRKVEVSDELALKIEGFELERKLVVMVEPGALNPFIRLKPNHIAKDPYAVSQFEYRLDTDAVLAWWESHGYATEIFSAEYLAAEAEEKAKEDAREERKKKARQEEQERNDRIDAAEQARKAEKETAQEKYEEDRKAWILQHGSMYLKQCLTLDYSANKAYVVERAAQEFPDFTPDLTDNARCKRKVNPSQDALDKLQALKELYPDMSITIVWQEHPARTGLNEDEDDSEFRSCESIWIEGYLGKYDLFSI